MWQALVLPAHCSLFLAFLLVEGAAGVALGNLYTSLVIFVSFV
jgi:hypothetical protein